MWSPAVLDPAFPGRSKIASGSPDPAGPWSAKLASGWKPQVFFHVAAAFSFSEHAVTIVASMPGGDQAAAVADAAGQFVVALIELNDMPPRVCRWLRNPS